MTSGLGERSTDLEKNHILSVPPPSFNQYPYKPLDAHHNEIRLLRACIPYEVDCLINCAIDHVSLDLNPAYEALSYTWRDGAGDAQLNRRIVLDGHIVAVTRNLEAALRQLLMGSESKVLWVDALCIDQANVAERNEQVRKMKLVYQQAAGVITWLGEEYDDSREAFKILQSLKEVGVAKSIYVGHDSPTEGANLSDDIVEKIHAVIKLFMREYWNRAWVVQEIFSARRVVFHCASDHITWEDMQSACGAIDKDGTLLNRALFGSKIGHIAWHLFTYGPRLLSRVDPDASNEGSGNTESTKTSRLDLLDATLGGLLIRHRIKRATDPRDKVYSLLGLVSSEKQSRIPVDYDLDTASVFKNVAAFIATGEHDLRFLAENKVPRVHLSDLDKSFSLPSWVPNWANIHEGDMVRLDRSAPWNSASGASVPEAYVHNCDILCVKGVRIGTITKASSLMPDLVGEEFDFESAFNVLYDWWLLFHSIGGRDLTGEKGFVDFINLRAYTRSGIIPDEERGLIEEEILMHLRIIFTRYKKDDTTLLPVIGKYEGVVDDTLWRRAETNLWSSTPIIRKRRVFAIDNAVCGIGPQSADIGDLVVVILGCKAPLVLRKRTEGDGDGYFNLGDTFVDGYMDGEAVKDLDDGKRESEVFRLY